MDQVEYGAIPFVHWYTIGEMHLIKGTYSIFLMDQVEYGAIPFVHWYQWSDSAFHWYTIGEMHLIKGT